MKRAFPLLLLVVVIFSGCRVSRDYSHNKSVKQDVISQDGDSVTIIPGKLYEAQGFKRTMLGDHYRDTWLTPVKVKVLNLDSAHGGLRIIRRGGGQQTYSLKLKAKNGKLYSLRSVQKDPTPSLPMALQYSFADDIVQDQISASYPYGAFILPPLGDKAGIYHTNPRLVYIPDSPQLGKYRKDYGGILAMLEEDADENWSDYEDFGYTENAVSTNSVLEALREDNDNSIDEKNLLKVRLFDMWIGDWDRHEGQFRWAELEKDGKGKLYRPIPEDRDNMLFKFDGIIPWVASRKWALRKFQDFYDVEVRDIAGLNFNGRHLDRRFLTGLSSEEWQQVATELQQSLTDESIEAAVRLIPEDVFAMNGEKIIATLKARRAMLDEYASRYYKVLAKEVDVLGSDEQELFQVTRMKNGDTEVMVFKTDDDGERKKKLYSRTFHPKETDEIRLYGQNGEDIFDIKGVTSKKAILVRAIPGIGEDLFTDSSEKKGCGRHTIVYELDGEENEINDGKDTKVVTDNSLEVTRYNFKEFTYDYLGPAAYFGYNVDDGIFLGGGLVMRTYGFRKYPYSSSQKLVGNFSPSTGAFNFLYRGDFVDVFGKVGIEVDAMVQAPSFFINYYGFGNDTKELVENDEYYRVRLQNYNVFPALKLRVSDRSAVKFGPAYQFAKVDRENDNFLATVEDSFGPGLYDDSHYLGFKFVADIKTTKSDIYPEKGIRFLASTGWYGELNQTNRKYSQLAGELRGYYTVRIPVKVTLAARIGAADNAGEYAFYQANTIGGNAGLQQPGSVRGFHRARFTGETSVYQNTELRVRLLKVPFYYLPFEFGLSGHHDIGRVWVPGENSDKWHSGVGGGVWFAPLRMAIFGITYTVSDEEKIYNANLGFFF